MKNPEYKISVHFENSKPIKIKNLVSFFGAIEDEYKTQLGKSLNLPYENCETDLAISEVKPGSQIFEIVALVSACIYPQANEIILEDLFDYLKTVLTDFASENKNLIEKYTKKNCKNTEDLTKIFEDDYRMNIDMSVYNKNKEIKELKVTNREGMNIYYAAKTRIAELELQKSEAFENAHLLFYQTRNDQNSSIGDRVIISSISSKPYKVSFMDNDIKSKLLSSNKNIYKSLYKADGRIKYKGDEIQEYVINKMSLIRDGEYND